MSGSNDQKSDALNDLYEESGYWHVNTGGETIHAKRMPGHYRRLKWLTSSVWLIFLLGPYLRYGDRQAVLFDIGNRQFHIFGITILPQDVWMLSLLLLFFAMLLAAVTTVAGRVFCGYFCFQTVWTDIFTLIEEKLEGPPAQRRKLDSAPLDFKKFRIKAIKHIIWISIGGITGITFAAWFTDAYHLWYEVVTLQAPPVVWGVITVFTGFTYGFAGYMREQVCFWLCPYARIQGVMYDRETILPAYDTKRGEPRGRLRKGVIEEGKGDCIDCNLCVVVCPTGIDIRNGQQEGCITCGLCIDACDSVMEKIHRPSRLIRYASYDELEGKSKVPVHKHPRALVYFGILGLALLGIIYGLTHLGTLDLKVIHERQPLYVLQSDGAIQNKYDLKILNKTDRELTVTLETESAIQDLIVKGDDTFRAKPATVFSLKCLEAT